MDSVVVFHRQSPENRLRVLKGMLCFYIDSLLLMNFTVTV
jgi:hypothetical protein